MAKLGHRRPLIFANDRNISPVLEWGALVRRTPARRQRPDPVQ
jgi:hypothetical protein